MSNISPTYCLSTVSWHGQASTPEGLEGLGDPSRPTDSTPTQCLSSGHVDEPSFSTETSISSSDISQELSPEELVNPPASLLHSAHVSKPVTDLAPTEIVTFVAERFPWSHHDHVGTPENSVPANLPYQNSDRVSVRLIAQKTIHVDDGKLGNKRSSNDDNAKQEPGKKRKKCTHVANNVPIHLTSNGGIPIDSTFLANSLPHIQHCAPGGQHNTQVSYDSIHPAPPYSPFPPYSHYGPNSNMTSHNQLLADIQTTRCMSSRYKHDPFPRCVSCTRRWAGDTCRFQGIRFFLRDENRNIRGISFVDSQTEEASIMDFPTSWNVPLDSNKICHMKVTIARGILPILKAEQEHLKSTELVRRPRETDVRATCDTCMTSIFSCAWMCRICGREACHDCAEKLRELTYPTRAMTAPGMKKMHPNPTFLSCTRKQEHAFRDFSPVSRFCEKELDAVVLEMENLLAEKDANSSTLSFQPNVLKLPGENISSTAETSSIRTAPESNPIENRLGNTPTIPQSSPFLPNNVIDLPVPVTSRPGDPDDLSGLGSHPYHIFNKNITDFQFNELWKNGQTLIVTDLLDNFLVHWSPEYFIEGFERNQCLILECNSNENKSVTVGDFFRQFGQFEGRSKIWKLKDWPPSADFKTAFPALYEDFMRAVPVPNYTRRDGSLNIASHFPKNTISPDLGPKMYNAFASTDIGSKGTTRLHLDMADAVNIMVYSTERPDGGEGMAVWDIFRAEDADKIRQFLHYHFKDRFANDPIHAQAFYLDLELRKRLYAETGVNSWRIYQRPGDAVFIPAGCAHQVANLSDCIKVACDFVSPQNIDRCFMLTRQFREQNRTMQWKEDVLQLYATLWFSWLSLSKVEQRRRIERKNEEEGTKTSIISSVS